MIKELLLDYREDDSDFFSILTISIANFCPR